jgi:hypothetical protein
MKIIIVKDVSSKTCGSTDTAELQTDSEALSQYPKRQVDTP